MKYTPLELAKKLGLQPSAISNEIKRGNLVKGKDRRIDSDNEKNKYWLVARGITVQGKVQKKKVTVGKKTVGSRIQKNRKENAKKKTAPKADRKKKEATTNFESISGLPDEMMNMTIGQLLRKHRDYAGLKLYVDVLDKLMSARKKEIDAMERRHKLIPRKFLDFLGVYINTLNNQLFDFADSCPVDLIALIKSDEKKAKNKIPEFLRKNYSKFIVDTRKKIDKEIKKMEKDIEDDSE